MSNSLRNLTALTITSHDHICYYNNVAVLNAAFCMTCSLLMLVDDARSDHMEEAYSRAGLITAL